MRADQDTNLNVVVFVGPQKRRKGISCLHVGCQRRVGSFGCMFNRASARVTFEDRPSTGHRQRVRLPVCRRVMHAQGDVSVVDRHGADVGGRDRSGQGGATLPGSTAAALQQLGKADLVARRRVDAGGPGRGSRCSPPCRRAGSRRTRAGTRGSRFRAGGRSPPAELVGPPSTRLPKGTTVSL